MRDARYGPKRGLRSTSAGRDRTFGASDRRQHDDLADSLWGSTDSFLLLGHTHIRMIAPGRIDIPGSMLRTAPE